MVCLFECSINIAMGRVCVCGPDSGCTYTQYRTGVYQLSVHLHYSALHALTAHTFELCVCAGVRPLQKLAEPKEQQPPRERSTERLTSQEGEQLIAQLHTQVQSLGGGFGVDWKSLGLIAAAETG